MRLNRQTLTAPGGGGGGSGGGSQRILAATLTYTGDSSADVTLNTASCAITGTLPNPSTILPTGTLQSIQLEFEGAVTYNMNFTVSSVSGFRDFLVQFHYFLYLASNRIPHESVVNNYSIIPSESTDAGLNATNQNQSAFIEIPAAQITSWPKAIFMYLSGSILVGNPAGPITVTWNSLVTTGTIKAYYLFA
jgi:hypothetical protein